MLTDPRGGTVRIVTSSFYLVLYITVLSKDSTTLSLLTNRLYRRQPQKALLAHPFHQERANKRTSEQASEGNKLRKTKETVQRRCSLNVEDALLIIADVGLLGKFQSCDNKPRRLEILYGCITWLDLLFPLPFRNSPSPMPFSGPGLPSQNIQPFITSLHVIQF